MYMLKMSNLDAEGVYDEHLMSTLCFSVFHSGIALSALNWSCIVVRVGLKSSEQLSGDGFSKLVALQAQLVHVAQASTRKSIASSTYLKLRRMWREVRGFYPSRRSVRGTVVARWTACQQAKLSILHQGHDS